MKSYIYLIISLVLITIVLSCNRKTAPSVRTEQVDRKDKQDRLSMAELEEQAVVDMKDTKIDNSEFKSTPLRNPFVDDPDTVLFMRKTACYGTCPQFILTIQADGSIDYYGRRNVDRIGFYSSKITKKKVFELDNYLHKISFYNLESTYPKNVDEYIVDASNTILFSEFNNKRNHVTINHAAPKEVMDFIASIDEMIEKLQWTKKPVDKTMD